MINQSSKINFIHLATSSAISTVGTVVSGSIASLFFQSPFITACILIVIYAFRISKKYIKSQVIYDYSKSFLDGCGLTMLIIVFISFTNGKTGIFGTIAPDKFVDLTQKISYFLAITSGTIALLFFFFGILEKNKKNISKTRLAQFFFFLGVAAFLLLVMNISNVIPFLKPYGFVLLLISGVSLTVSLAFVKATNEKKY